MGNDEATTHLEGDPASAAVARRFVRSTLEAWDRPELEEAATLLVSELVGNAVLHARTAIDLVVVRDGDRLRIEVTDGSPVLPEPKHYSVTSGTGRGLALVDSLSDDWGAERSPSGKTVWFELTDLPSRTP
ncbi:MAG: ATP-binding protein [Actinomycetota bacterium]|nr:ATP-binding protein [Actinomycetota bacterium]